MQTRINETILQHPSAVNVTQLLKMPDFTKGDKTNEDLNELKNTLTNVKTKTDQVENYLNETFKRIPTMEQSINSLKAEV